MESAKIFDASSISTIHVTLSEIDYKKLLSNINSDEYLLARMTFESPTISKKEIDSIGFRLRGAAVRNTDKKSFKISFRAFGFDDREFFGLRKINLNSDFQDPNLMRSKLCTDLFRQMGVNAARVGYSKLYINGEYRGLFANYEDFDKNFLKSRFENNNGNLYKCPGNSDFTFRSNEDYKYIGAYELTTNEEFGDYSDLAFFIDRLNNTKDEEFKKEIEKILDVNNLLLELACNVLLGAWDDYWVLAKNFYFYNDPGTGKFYYFPHDFDGSLGTDWYHGNIANANVYDWSPNGNRPLVERILSTPEYKKKYTQYISLICSYPFSLEAFEPSIEKTANLIRESLTNDPYWSADNGWYKSDFDESLENSIPRGNVRYGMKEYISLRRESAREQLENVGPLMDFLSISNKNPKQIEEVIVSLFIYNDKEIDSAILTYSYKDAIYHLEFTDDGLGIDAKANDNIYTCILPPTHDDSEIKFHLESFDVSGESSRLPYESDEYYYLRKKGVAPKLFINELMAQNDSTKHDDFDEYDDWFEIYNPNDFDVDLHGMYVSDDLSDTKKWMLKNLVIPANGYQLFWADGQPEQGFDHVDFKLSSNGEEIGIYSSTFYNNVKIDSVVFDKQSADISFGRVDNGIDDWIYFDSPTPGYGNNDTLIVFDNLKDITELGGIISEPNNNSPENELIANAIDNNVDTKYLTFESSTWIKYELETPTLVNGYSITSANDAPERDPRNWKFEAWDETNSEWLTLDEIKNEPSWNNRFETKEFYFHNKEQYYKYRLNISSPNGGSIIQLAEIEILGTVQIGPLYDITDIEGSIIEFNDNSPDTETIEKLIDNDLSTKYLTFQKSTIIEFSQMDSTLVKGYVIYSANDAPERDPSTWDFEAWDDSSSTWEIIHSIKDEPTWENRFQAKEFLFGNHSKYNRYRINITSPSHGEIIQIAELEILAEEEEPITSTEIEELTLPTKFELNQNYPNPFNPSTNISYSIPELSQVNIEVYDILGQRVAHLVSMVLNAGNYTHKWNASGLPSGVYIIRMMAASQKSYRQFNEVKKALLMK